MATPWKPQSTHNYHPLASVTIRFANLIKGESGDVIHTPDERTRRDKDRAELAARIRKEKYPT